MGCGEIIQIGSPRINLTQNLFPKNLNGTGESNETPVFLARRKIWSREGEYNNDKSIWTNP